MTRNALILLTTSLLAGTAGTPASAHPKLQLSDPAAGATVNAAVSVITMSFSEAVVQKFSGISVQNDAKQSAPVLSTSVDANDKKKLVVRLKSPLKPGNYEVQWHAVAADTHRVEGHFSFVVSQ